MLKKGQKILSVNISRGVVKAYTETNDIISLTRSQRNALADFKNPNYIENICKEFSRKDLLCKSFSVIVDGNIAFRLKDQ